MPITIKIVFFIFLLKFPVQKYKFGLNRQKNIPRTPEINQ